MIKLDKRYYRRYQINLDFFQSWSEPMAYSLGFLLADGNVTSHTIRAEVHQRDRIILEYLRDKISPDNVIRDYIITRKDNNKEKKSSVISFNSIQLIESVKIFGLVPKKSDKIFLPDVPTLYFGHFLRGFFDGDGTVYTSKYHPLSSGFSSISLQFLLSLQERLKFGKIFICGSSKKALNKVYQLMFEYRDSIRLREIIYNNEEFALERKKHIFFHHRQPRNNRLAGLELEKFKTMVKNGCSVEEFMNVFNMSREKVWANKSFHKRSMEKQEGK